MVDTDIPEEVRKQIRGCGNSDIVIGVPSFNNEATIGNYMRVVSQGLAEYFPSARSVIINADCGSKDGTVEQAARAVPDVRTLIRIPYRPNPILEFSQLQAGTAGRLNALRLILQAARELGAKACAIFSPEVQSIAPDWIGALVRPVVDGKCDYAGAYYTRHKFDGGISSGIIYPMTRSLYGKRIRHPIGRELCFSSKLLDHFLNQDVWDGGASPFGMDIWMTTHAVCFGFRTCQVLLGKRVDAAREPAPDLSSMLRQILGVVFAEMEKNARIWQRIRGSENIRMSSEGESLDCAPVEVDAGPMIESYRLGFKNLFELWSLIIPPASLLELKKLAQRADPDFSFPDQLWTHVLYDFAVAYHLKIMNRDHLLSALTPLYLGWVASFVLQMQNADAARVDARIEELCLRFEAEKPYLISRWRWPDRFNP